MQWPKPEKPLQHPIISKEAEEHIQRVGRQGAGGGADLSQRSVIIETDGWLY